MIVLPCFYFWENCFYILTDAFIPTNRFQAEAVSKFGIIFFLWDVVSKVLRLQEVSGNITHSQETLDFVTSHQNFSITEFVKNNGFYLNRDTLLDCKFFGKPCGPKVMVDYLPKSNRDIVDYGFILF